MILLKSVDSQNYVTRMHEDDQTMKTLFEWPFNTSQTVKPRIGFLNNIGEDLSERMVTARAGWRQLEECREERYDPPTTATPR